MAKKKTAKKAVQKPATSSPDGMVVIHPIEQSFLTVPCIGLTDIICNRITQKVKGGLIGKHLPGGKGRKKGADEARNIWQEGIDSGYWVDDDLNLVTPPESPIIETDPLKATDEDLVPEEVNELLRKGQFAIPSQAVVHACVSAARNHVKVHMTNLKQSFSVPQPYFSITGDPYIRIDVVKVGGKGRGTGTAVMRYRLAFRAGWRCDMLLDYMPGMISAESLMNLLNTAGFACGILENRPTSPDTPGPHGRFTIANFAQEEAAA